MSDFNLFFSMYCCQKQYGQYSFSWSSSSSGRGRHRKRRTRVSSFQCCQSIRGSCVISKCPHMEFTCFIYVIELFFELVFLKKKKKFSITRKINNIKHLCIHGKSCYDYDKNKFFYLKWNSVVTNRNCILNHQIDIVERKCNKYNRQYTSQYIEDTCR